MENSKKLLIFAGGVLLLVAVGFLLAPKTEQETSAPKGSIYYTGPMKVKGGDTYGTIDGKNSTKEAADRASAEYQKQASPGAGTPTR